MGGDGQPPGPASRGNAPMNGSIDAVPRNYNAAADMIKRNLAAGRGDKAAYIDDRGSLTAMASSPSGSSAAATRCAPRAPTRRAHPPVPARHDRLADRFPGRDQGRHRAGSGQHDADRVRLWIHARRQPGPAAHRLGRALPKFAKADRACRTLRHVIVSGR